MPFLSLSPWELPETQEQEIYCSFFLGALFVFALITSVFQALLVEHDERSTFARAPDLGNLKKKKKEKGEGDEINFLITRIVLLKKRVYWTQCV